MLETVLEQLLLRFLAPYVEGISRDRLRVGVLKGSVELADLRVKAEALALLGMPTLRVKTGNIGRLRLQVPWKRLYSGKVSVSVEAFHFEVERIGDDATASSDEEVIRQLREAKRRAIELRASQLEDLVRQRDEERGQEEEPPAAGADPAASSAPPGDAGGSAGSAAAAGRAPKHRQGFMAKLIRKIINNVHIELQDARASYANAAQGLACGVELKGLDVQSTDAQFRTPTGGARGADEEVVVPNGALYKLLRLRELSFSMAAAGVGDLSDAAYVLRPVSASLRLAHEPLQGLVRTEFEVARQELLELTLVRSQVKHLRNSQAIRGQEYLRLYRLMVPQAEEETLFQDANQNLAEYGALFERQLVHQEGLVEAEEGGEIQPLAKHEVRRLQLLEDTLAIGLLARRQALVRKKVGALLEERRRLTREPGSLSPAQARMGALGSLIRWATTRRPTGRDGHDVPAEGEEGRGAGGGGATSSSAASAASSTGGLGFTHGDRERLFMDLEDDSKFEEVDMPTRMRFEFALGAFAVDMVDDRWLREEQRQVLSLALEQAQVVVCLNFATDYHGRDSAEWSLEMHLGAFHAFQAAHVALQFCTARAPAGATRGRASTSAFGGVAMGPQRSVPMGRERSGSGRAGNAARLVVASELGRDQNVLKLLFDFAPTVIHMPQGLVEEIRDFFRSDVVAAVAEATVPPQDTPVATPRHLNSLHNLHRTVSELESIENTTRVAEMMYERMPHTVGSRDNAHLLARKVAERIPDKLELDVSIASPIFHVPVPGQGTTIFSLGLFQLRTPQPCEYSQLDIHCRLNEMVLCAVTLRGERFDMFQPVLFDVQVQYRSNDEGSMVTVGVEAEQASVALVPQSLQMLMATPFAMAGVMWEKERPRAHAATGGSDMDPAHPLEAEAEAPDPELAVEEEAAAGERPDTDALEVPRQFIFSMTMQFDALDLTLADSVVPVMVLHMRWIPPGLQIYRHRLPHATLTTDIVFTLEVEILNPRNNAWEPLIERFHGGIQVERECPGDDRQTKITVSGREQLLLNLKPTMLQRAVWFVPVFLTGLTFEQDLVVTSSDAATADVSKYRVVNLCNQTLELEFKSCHRAGLVTQIEPTGSNWETLDKWVVSPYFATALVVRLPGGQSSQPLSLEHDGAVAIPDSGMVAELLTPSPLDRMQHRMLLLATSLRVHNQTDLPLLVRFHTADLEVLALPLPSTMACDAALLGHFPKEYVEHDDGGAGLGAAEDDPDAARATAMLLPPNALGAVPLPALVREQGADVGISHAWLSVKPAGLDLAFCSAVELGAKTEPRAIHCLKRWVADSRPDAAAPAAGDMHLVCESRATTVAVPSPITLTTIALQAPLTLLNALPIGDLIVGYGPRMGEQGPTSCWQEARVPRLKHLNLYNFSGMLLEDGITIRAQLARGAPWSALHHFGRAAFKERGAVRHMQLRQRPDGAAAGVVVEHVDGFELRFSCPFWFADRSGLERSLGLRLLHGGLPLPEADGVTLLPSSCLEEDCEIVVAGGPSAPCCAPRISLDPVACGRELCSGPGKMNRPTGTASYKIRMPPNFCILAMSTRLGPKVFCVQAEDVASADMLGAECQVMTLRPRLILTNASAHELEVTPVEDGVLLLSPGQSHEVHWAAKSGEDLPSTSLCFRPVCQPPCQWSGEVLCSDEAAGSRPFLLLATPGSRLDSKSAGRALGLGIPQVWSAEVAPVRGSLAVSFRAGSAFVAENRSSRVKMMVRPLEGGKALADIPVPLGKEVPYGWARPFHRGQRHAIDAIIGGKRYHIDDVRLSKRSFVPSLNVFVAIARVGTRTLLTLEDCETGVGRQVRTDGGRSTLQIDLKLSRLGVSLIEEVPQPRELLYVHLDLIRLEWQKASETDTKRLKFVISDAQVDCQLPGRAAPDRLGPSLGLMKQDRPAVILANCGSGDRMFLKLLIEQGATSSQDIMIPRAEVAIDQMDITIDDGWLDPLASFFSQCRAGGQGSQGLPLAGILHMAGSTYIRGYAPPPLPSVVQVEAFEISEVKFTLWCALKLRSAGFLPPYLRDALRVLSLSDELNVEDATLSLPQRRVALHRGSLKDFLRGLASEYTMNLLNIAGVALGKSSLLNLPRVPLRIGGSTVSFLTDTMGLMAGEAASLMNHLTFDDEYVARQRQIRQRKQIHGLADAMHEAGRSLGQGLEGVLDVVKKPAEGWKARGLEGAVVGVGKGVAGGFVKPISNIGQAISDVGAGISATVGPDTANVQRRRARPRLRLPRLLFSDGGAIRPWSDLEAEVLRQLGSRCMRGIQEIVPLAEEGQQYVVLLLYTYKLALIEIAMPSQGGGGGSSSSSSTAGAGNKEKAAMNLLGAIDESNRKIFRQALKPFTQLVESMKERSGGGLDSVDGANGGLRLKASECLDFRNLRAVRSTTDGAGPLLELTDVGGRTHPLPLYGGPGGVFSEAVRAGLERGFLSALSHPDGAANWGELRAALREEQRTRQELASADNAVHLTEAGQLTLEVYEVERWMLITNEWQTPNLPTDHHLRWRWVDATGSKHPHVQQRLGRKEVANSRRPPCELDSLFQPAGEWTIERSANTDEAGWSYGTAWRASTWEPKPGLFDVLRRRRWQRHYK